MGVCGIFFLGVRIRCCGTGRGKEIGAAGTEEVVGMRYQYWRELENGKAEVLLLARSPTGFAVNNPRKQRFVAKKAPAGAQFAEMTCLIGKKSRRPGSQTPAIWVKTWVTNFSSTSPGLWEPESPFLF